VSKNVAVFVDVANIFYAAKAAGVDIDYVTLLKSSIAGRDFVRAYAYTGLDPENENQRQFHSFLARNGYKVVSKDIRKYGDGRIKANLDIELVVDMMRMAQHLDIAVVVSGDGDFAPAIRAVQQMGVRVEVVSFRGNTSSDLIEVADGFTDIAQIARVDKGSVRSGRRVAAEGDLSMTEVPEKETEGAPRRRRTRARSAEPEAAAPAGVAPAGVAAAAAETAGMPGNLIVLPGERLSRAPDEVDTAEPAAAEDADGGEDRETDLETGEETAEGRRRRRRRGGRGRGRGRRDAESEALEATTTTADAEATEAEEEDEEEFEAVPPAQLPHQTFGSVWDTQLGVPSAPISTSAEVFAADEEEYEDEPEIPEYLLAERRQRGQQRGPRGRMGGGRGRGAGYQAAVERERYGRGGGSSFGAPRLPDRQRGGDRQRPARPQQQRQPRAGQRPRDQRPPDRPAPAASAQPWSEVPPEVEELLRAELARRAPAAEPAQPQFESVDATTPSDMPAEAEPKRRAPRRRTTKAQPEAETAQSEQAPAGEPEQAPVKPARAPRRRAAAAQAESGAEAAAEEVAEEAPAKPKRATRSRKAATPASETEAATEASSSTEGSAPEEAAKKPVRRRRTKAAEAADAEPADQG
jgi:uncharacterized LabA/DUF88 family protein